MPRACRKRQLDWGDSSNETQKWRPHITTRDPYPPKQAKCTQYGPKFCSPSPEMAIFPYESNIFAEGFSTLCDQSIS